MPVISIANGVSIPLPLEPDIEHIRLLKPTPFASHNNTGLITSTTISPCGSSLNLAMPTSYPFANCSDPSQDIAAGPWWIRLLLGHDVVYYVFPVMLTCGLLCDIVASCVLIGLVCSGCRARASSRLKGSRSTFWTTATAGGRCLGNVYLLWNAVSSALMLACCSTRRLSDYVDVEAGRLRVYTGAVDEWLSYASLWLLIAMDLEKALQLTTTDPECRESHPTLPAIYKSAFVIDEHAKEPGTASKLIVSVIGSSYRKETLVCCAVYAVCLVSAMPHFFSFQLVESFDISTNKTIFVPHHSDELTDSFEYRVIYYWYVVGLTILLPVPVLLVVSIVICRTLVSRRRQRKMKMKRPASVQSQHHAKNGGNSSVVVVSKSIMTHKPSLPPSSITSGGSNSRGAGSDAVALTGRLLVVTTALYLVFTMPRNILTCMEGLPSSKWSTTVVTVDSGPGEVDVEYSVVGEVIRSLADFSFYLYHASALPLLSSYHDDFHAALIRLICSCCSRRRLRTRRLKSAKEYNSGGCQGQIHTRKRTTKKTVKFDSRTIEFEIQC